MSNKTLLLSILSLLIGFTCAYLIFGNSSKNSSENRMTTQTVPTVLENDALIDTTNSHSTMSGQNAFAPRLEQIENSISAIQQQIQEIEFTITESRHSSTDQNANSNSRASISSPNRQSRFRQRFTVDRLIKGGLDFAVAEDFVRRKNAVEIKRLELNDRATRENYINTQRYFDELAAIDATDVNLREELGDQQYDSYLFQSRQTNRIKITSVMLGSAAEKAGIEKNDIILSYDNKPMFTWPELKQATSEGKLSEYVSITISRNGEVYSYSVPRGTLGIQMGATRLQP